MEKTFLSTGLNNAYRFAQKKESIFREYNNELNLVRHKIADLGETKIWQRLLVGMPIFVLMVIFFTIADVNYISGVEFEYQPALHRVFSVALYITIGILIIAQKLIKRVLPYTNWYKSRHTVLLAEEQEIHDTYRPVISDINSKGIAALPTLGAKYHTTYILNQMIDYVDSGRADTIKELIAAYETDCHRNRVENNQDRILHELAEQQDEINQLSSQLQYVTYYR